MWYMGCLFTMVVTPKDTGGRFGLPGDGRTERATSENPSGRRPENFDLLGGRTNRAAAGSRR